MSQKKLFYYPIGSTSEEKSIYANGLNDITSVGGYIVKMYHCGVGEDLPFNICGNGHYIVALLFVTENGSERTLQKNRVIGQTLISSNCNNGLMEVYSRSYSFLDKVFSWSSWEIVNKNVVEQMINSIVSEINSIDLDSIRSLLSNIQLLKENVYKSMFEKDYCGEEPINCAPINEFSGYYTIDNEFVPNSSFVTYIYELNDSTLYNITSHIFATDPVANIVLFDNNLVPIVSVRELIVDENFRRKGFFYIGLSSGITGTKGIIKSYTRYYILKERIGNSTINKENIAIDSVGPEHTTFFKSKNLFNKNDENVVLGGYDVGTGIQSNSSLNFSGLISVNSGETYSFSVGGVAITARFVTFYNRKSEYFIPEEETVCYKSAVGTITIPNGVSFVRLTIAKSYWENFQMEKGIEPTEYTSYKPVIKDEYLPIYKGELIDEVIGRNLADPLKITKGKYYINYQTGEIGSGIGGGYTDYIPITEAGLAITGTYKGGILPGNAIYDKNKKYIRGVRENFIIYNKGDAYVRFSVEADANVMVTEGVVPMDFEAYSDSKEIIENVSKKVIKKVNISLPNKIYAVVGDTLQLFYRGIIQAVNPYCYNILVSCSKGKQYSRYFEYTPNTSDIGTVDFKIQISDDDGNVISANACKLVTVDVVKSPATDMKVMCFGDSLTSAGIWCREVDRRLTETDGVPKGNGLTNINFVGSNINGTTGYFGIGGWSWESYTTAGSPAIRFNVSSVSSLVVGATYTNNGYTYTIREVNVTEGTGNILCAVGNASYLPQDSGTLTKKTGGGDASIKFTSYSVDSQNPLWDGSKMTFVPYANKVSNGQIDVVYTLLSWNGQTPWRTDFASVIEHIKIFADTLHTEFPDAKLKIMGIQIPSINGGMGATYGATGTSYADSYGMVVTALNMNKVYQDFANSEGYSDFVEFVNVSSQFDSEYNMQSAEKLVNTRSCKVELIGTNGVHPSTEGYMQIADVVYRNFVANFC